MRTARESLERGTFFVVRLPGEIDRSRRSRTAGSDEPRVVGGNHRLDAIPHAELAQDCRYMRLHRRLAEVQPRSELGVREPAREESQDLPFAVCELLERTPVDGRRRAGEARSEEHTSELQSRPHLVCRLLLEK